MAAGPVCPSHLPHLPSNHHHIQLIFAFYSFLFNPFPNCVWSEDPYVMWERVRYCSFMHDTNHFAAMWQNVMWQMAHMSCDTPHVTESNDFKKIQYSRKDKRIWCAVFDLMFISFWLKDGLFNWNLCEEIKFKTGTLVNCLETWMKWLLVLTNSPLQALPAKA